MWLSSLCALTIRLDEVFAEVDLEHRLGEYGGSTLLDVISLVGDHCEGSGWSGMLHWRRFKAAMALTSVGSDSDEEIIAAEGPDAIGDLDSRTNGHLQTPRLISEDLASSRRGKLT